MIMRIKLDTIEKIKSFVEEAVGFESELTIKCGRYIVSAKSVMGILSLNLDNTVELAILPVNEKELSMFMDKFENFKVVE